MELTSWQSKAEELILDGENVLVVAGINEGKTHLCTHVANQLDDVRVVDAFDFEQNNHVSYRDIFTSANRVFIDEAGRLTTPIKLKQAMDAYTDTQVVLFSLPSCPTVMMLSHRFTVVQADS